MQTFKNILFPIDFSECSEKVFPQALDMAKKFNARLHLLFVARDISYLTTVSVPKDTLMNTVAEIARGAEEEMEAFCKKQLSDFSDYEAKVLIGNPGEDILKYAQDEDIDLIIMGTHGRKGLERTLMGSVADLVVRRASVPVMTVNPFRTQVKYVHT
ncbi:MAG: universal stress protein [Thermodesulfobacteriota bacterium]|nr:universal stress protein [Thermodesulfobacteriota bacterium]